MRILVCPRPFNNFIKQIGRSAFFILKLELRELEARMEDQQVQKRGCQASFEILSQVFFYQVSTFHRFPILHLVKGTTRDDLTTYDFLQG